MVIKQILLLHQSHRITRTLRIGGRERRMIMDKLSRYSTERQFHHRLFLCRASLESGGSKPQQDLHCSITKSLMLEPIATNGSQRIAKSGIIWEKQVGIADSERTKRLFVK